MLKRSIIDMARAVGPDAGLRQVRALLAIREPFTGLDRIHCPTVLIGGRGDHRTTPATHEALAQAIPGSALMIIDDAAHFTPLEQLRIVTEVLQHWIKQWPIPLSGTSRMHTA
jgi:pimeloyl-ACP methyl ester carboxylesterase